MHAWREALRSITLAAPKDLRDDTRAATVMERGKLLGMRYDRTQRDAAFRSLAAQKRPLVDLLFPFSHVARLLH